MQFEWIGSDFIPLRCTSRSFDTEREPEIIPSGL